MNTDQNEAGAFDEKQSLQVIKEMIQVSRKRLKNDGILFILWGWISFITYFLEYLAQTIPHIYQMTLFKRYVSVLLPITGIIYSVIYVIRKSRKATTYIGIALRYVWISMFAGMVLINLIQNNVLHKITFELQLPIFMVLVAFAIVVTGGILRYKMIIAGGIIFGLLAYVASLFPLNRQLLIESIAWFIAFIIPGHILYAKRKG
jgi:hypothetical protein